MSETPSSSPRVAWMDLARVLAALWVVTIHVAAVPVVHMKAVPAEWWWWANVYNCLSRAAVPLFVMLSGALLLNTPRWDMAVFFRKRAAKLLAPLLGWTLFYWAWRARVLHTPLDPSRLPAHVFNGLSDPAYPHLWFLWIIASLYLLTPLFQRFVAHASAREQLYFGVMWLLFTGVMPLLQRYAGWELGLLLQPAFGYVGYYVAGAALQRWLPPRLGSFHIVACGAVFMAGAGFAAVMTHALSVHGGQIDETFMAPLSINVMLMALSAFVFLRHIGTQEEGRAPGRLARLAQHPWVMKLSLWSFGIYLIHPWMLDLMDLMAGLSLDPMRHHTGWYVPFMAVLAFGLAAGLTALLRRLPGACRLVP